MLLIHPSRLNRLLVPPSLTIFTTPAIPQAKPDDGESYTALGRLSPFVADMPWQTRQDKAGPRNTKQAGITMVSERV